MRGKKHCQKNIPRKCCPKLGTCTITIITSLICTCHLNMNYYFSTGWYGVILVSKCRAEKNKTCCGRYSFCNPASVKCRVNAMLAKLFVIKKRLSWNELPITAARTTHWLHIGLDLYLILFYQNVCQVDTVISMTFLDTIQRTHCMSIAAIYILDHEV